MKLAVDWRKGLLATSSRWSRSARSPKRRRIPHRLESRRPRLRLDHRPLREPRRPSSLRRRAARAHLAHRAVGARSRDRHLREGARRSPRPSVEPPAPDVRAAQEEALREGVQRRGCRAAAAIRGRSLPRREPHPPRGHQPRRRGMGARHTGPTRGDHAAGPGGRRHARVEAVASLHSRLADRQQRRRLSHHRRRRWPRVLREPDLGERRRSLRRRDHWLRPGMLHDSAAEGPPRGPLPSPSELLRSWADGLRDGQARGHRERRETAILSSTNVRSS